VEGHAPGVALLAKLAVVSLGSFVLGFFFFRRLRRHFYDYL
jgi:hypothetical protein